MNIVNSNPAITITLNDKGLNLPIKRQRLLQWIKTHEPTIWFFARNTLKKQLQ